MSFFEKFISKGNGKAYELATEGARLDGGHSKKEGFLPRMREDGKLKSQKEGSPGRSAEKASGRV